MKRKSLDVSKIPEPRINKAGPSAAKRRLRGPSERTVEQREADLAFIADKLIRGTLQRDIATELDRLRPYKFSLDMVKADSGELVKRWRSLALGDIDDQKAEQLARIMELERQAWRALARLENGIERTVARKTKYTPKTRESKSAMKVRDNKDTTAAWLRTLQFCIVERSKILGLYAPLKLDAKGANLHFGDVNNVVGVSVNITTEKPLEALGDFEIIDAAELIADETPEEP